MNLGNTGEDFQRLNRIGRMAAEAAICRDPVRRKSLRKEARKARKEFDAGRAVLL